jgi:transcription initiation factor TFIIIB Brf1 subunit/transcription initiation factor TFIIB
MDSIYDSITYGSEGSTVETIDNSNFNDFDYSILDKDNPFDTLIDDDEFMEFCNKEINDSKTIDYNICCNIQMMSTENGFIACSKCNNTKPIYGDYDLDHVNVCIPQTIAVGKKAYQYAKLLHRTNKCDYDKMRDKYIGDIINRMYNASKIKLMPDITYDARMMCLSIMKVKTYRTKVLREVMAACLYYACIKAGQLRRPKEIASFAGLETDGFSIGDSIVIEMSKKGVVDIKTNINPAKSYIRLNMQKLGIYKKEHENFAYNIVCTAQKYNIAINSMSYSKSIGAIYLITEQLYPNLTLDTITKECDIHHNTIRKFTSEVKSYFSYFRNIYIAFKIPLPSDLSTEIPITKKKEYKKSKKEKDISSDILSYSDVSVDQIRNLMKSTNLLKSNLELCESSEECKK